jgi:hypothetical protein
MPEAEEYLLGGLVESPYYPLQAPPPDEQTAAYLALVEAQLQVDWSAMFLGYHIVRSLRELRDQVRFRGWPRTFEERLHLSLIPYLDQDAQSGGLDWSAQAPLHGPLAALFDIDARTMNEGRGRAELSPAEFSRYVLECRALFAEFSAIRARMHNGEP